jgi:hypothetical protein
VILHRIRHEQKGIRKVFKKYFPEGTYTDPKILNFCCGLANEEPIIYEHFGEGTNLISLDSCENAEKNAQYLGRKSFVRSTVQDFLENSDERFDIIMGRNVPLNPKQDDYYKSDEDPWPEIFHNMRTAFSTDGILFLTLLLKHEFHRCLDILDDDYNIRESKFNRITVVSDKYGTDSEYKDHYIIMAEPVID